MTVSQPSRALRLRKVCDLVGYAPASIWMAWDEIEVLDWLEAKKAARQGVAP